jgi:ribosomal protein S18 acetylase RimI-like enzyme
MDSLLEIVINEPFQADLIKHLYADKKDLHLAFPKAKYPFCRNQWQEVVNKDPDNTSLLFKLNQEVVGHSAFIINGESLYICFIIIEQEHRRKGLAKELISKSEEFCRLNYPHQDLWLNVNRTNTSAVSLYISMRYETRNVSGDKITMTKRIKS